MYIIFAPNKYFVQFQLSDYLGHSTDLIVGFTMNLPISFKKMAKKQDAQNTNADHIKISEEKYVQKQLADYDPELPRNLKESAPKIGRRGLASPVLKRYGSNTNPLKFGEKRYIQKQITDYIAESSESLQESVSNIEIYDLSPPTEERHGFNIIPLNSNTKEPFIIQKGNSERDNVDDNWEGSYYLQGYYGRYLPFTERLEEKKEITSRYTPGLLHEKYLEDFELFAQLEELGVKKSGGFAIKVLFLILYYVYFAISNSFERFSYINSEEFSILINNLSKPKPDTLRKFLKGTITLEIALNFTNFMYYRINQLDQRIGFAAYIDEHFVIYQGTKKMAKGKGGSKNKVAKGFYRFYLTCALFSIPIFNMPKEGSTRLEKVIFNVLAAYQEVSQKKIHLIIFDRGIKSFKTLKQLHKTGYNFICWSFPYKTIEQALKRRHRLKLVRISTMVKELITIRAESSNTGKLTGRTAKMKAFFGQMLPTSDLQAQLRELEQKEKGVTKWNSRDFVRLKDVHMEFDEYGVIRAIILEKESGERIAIFTDIPAELAHPLEILIGLKKKQKIENYFAYKIAIQGDYIPFWELQVSELQKTKFNYKLEKPDLVQVEKFETRIKRIKNALKKLELGSRTWKSLFKKGKITKNRLKKLDNELTHQVNLKKAERKEIRAFLRWAKKNKKPTYFAQFEPIMELNPRMELFLNTINDLFFVNSRRIASDLGNSLKIAKSHGEFTLSDKKIHEISNFTPEKLNDILIKGGGKVLINPNNNREIIAELHTELLHKDEVLIAPYLRMLNQLHTEHKFCFDTHYSIKFTNNLLDIPKLVKIV
jgi:hypothetical protein